MSLRACACAYSHPLRLLSPSASSRRPLSMPVSVQYLVGALNGCFLSERPAITGPQLYGHRVAAIFAALKAPLRSGSTCPTHLVHYCELLLEEIVRSHYHH